MSRSSGNRSNGGIYTRDDARREGHHYTPGTARKEYEMTDNNNNNEGVAVVAMKDGKTDRLGKGNFNGRIGGSANSGQYAQVYAKKGDAEATKVLDGVQAGEVVRLTGFVVQVFEDGGPILIVRANQINTVSA